MKRCFFWLWLLSGMFLFFSFLSLERSSVQAGREGQTASTLSPKQALGKALFFDKNLSTPAGQACVDCHHPDHGFSNPDDGLPVSRGVHPDRFGNRNDLSAAYGGLAPPLHYDKNEEAYVGGNFWDGRVNDLVEQAKGPFLNVLEMANPNEEAVVAGVRKASYAPLFRQVFGPDSLADVKKAFHWIAEAIAEYEMSPEVNRFSSKYDYFLQGKAKLSLKEQRGLELFNEAKKGNCAACHPSASDASGKPPLFTDFTYDNLGVPANPENPFYSLPKALNPDGYKYIDRGLGAFLKKPSEDGKFRVPSLRNVALTGPYMHNGVFKTIRQVVSFYNTRDVAPWPKPEVSANLNKEELGDLGLSEEEIDQIVAFLLTLTDGWKPSL